jgi:hypothetical protein
MFWKLFGSDRRVEEALEQSVGYDISPNEISAGVLQMPANSDQLKLMPDPVPTPYYFTASWTEAK